MIENKQLDEAHKVGDKVIIKHPSKDIKGKTGRIGEIRGGLYKGSPKTFTIDYDHIENTGQAKSIQLKAKHIQGVKEQVENLQEKHRVAITLSDPHHPAVTKRKELIQKTVRVKADNPGHAVDSAIHHFRKAGYKVHDHHYIGTVKEGVMPTFKELDESGLETFRKAAAEREKEANKREAEMKARHASGKEDMKGAIDTLASRFKTEDTVLENAPFKSKDDAVKYAKDKVKTHRDKLDGIEIYSHSGGYDVNHTANSSGRNSLHKVGAKHIGTVYKESVELDFEKQDYKIHEETVEEGTFKYHMDKAVAAHSRGDETRKKFHLSNAKQARYSLKSTEISKHKDLLDKYKSMTEDTDLEESRNQADKYWDEAEKHKAEAQKHKVGSEAHHTHMANHYDAMHRYHADLGQHSAAEKASDKADQHHEKSLQAESVEEDVAANNVGGGNIAGTQGDAGKKSVMTKEPLKRKTFKQFSEAAVDGKGHKSSTGGLTQKGRDYYNNKTGGNLQAPVTTPPSKLKAGSKAANRRKSFCARMGGMPGPMKDEKGRPTRKALALRKWNC